MIFVMFWNVRMGRCYGGQPCASRTAGGLEWLVEDACDAKESVSIYDTDFLEIELNDVPLFEIGEQADNGFCRCSYHIREILTVGGPSERNSVCLNTIELFEH